MIQAELDAIGQVRAVDVRIGAIRVKVVPFRVGELDDRDRAILIEDGDPVAP